MNLPKQHTNYCYALGLLVCCFYIVVASLNAYIDPRGFFMLSDDIGQRYFVSPTRLEKSIRLYNEPYDVIAIGSSRVEVGIDPASKLFSKKSVYNLGLSATNMYELHRVIDYTLEHQNPKIILIGLDFLMFTSQRELHRDFDSSLFSRQTHYIPVIVEYLTSLEVLKESALSILYQYESRPGTISARGFLDKSGSKVNHRDLFDKILSQNFFIKNDTYAGYVYSKEREQLLAEVMDKIVRRGISLKIFISPIHARQEEAIAIAGLYDVYEQWKIAMVDIVRKLNDAANGSVRMCDFSGYTSVTTEQIPVDANTSMEWYWESSHYKKELGERIISDLFTDGPPSLPQANCALTPENINKHLHKVRMRQAEYRKNNPFEIQEVNRIYAETAPIRLQNTIKNNNRDSN